MWFIVTWFVFCKQKSAYEMVISDWSSDVCSTDLALRPLRHPLLPAPHRAARRCRGHGLRPAARPSPPPRARAPPPSARRGSSDEPARQQVGQTSLMARHRPTEPTVNPARGAALVAVAVLVGLVLLRNGHDTPGAVRTSGDDDTERSGERVGRERWAFRFE